MRRRDTNGIYRDIFFSVMDRIGMERDQKFDRTFREEDVHDWDSFQDYYLHLRTNIILAKFSFQSNM